MPTRTANLLLAAAALAVLVGVMLAGQWLGSRYLSPNDGGERVVLTISAGCTATEGGCEAEGEGVGIQLALPTEPSALTPFPVRVRVRGLTPDQVALVRMEFEMVGMDMGLNRLTLEPREPGMWAAAATLPVCVAGRSDWFARVTVRGAAGQIYQADFPFSTTGPG